MSETPQPTIDYSALDIPVTRTDEDWEPPPHVYYGKRQPNGKKEKEPVYIYQEFPRAMYAWPDKTKGIVVKEVKSQEELELLGPGWEKSAAAFGYIGAPSKEQSLRLQGSGAMALIDAQTERNSEAARLQAQETAARAQAEAEQEAEAKAKADQDRLNAMVAAAVAAALPAAVQAHLEAQQPEKRGPGRPPKGE